MGSCNSPTCSCTESSFFAKTIEILCRKRSIIPVLFTALSSCSTYRFMAGSHCLLPPRTFYCVESLLENTGNQCMKFKYFRKYSAKNRKNTALLLGSLEYLIYIYKIEKILLPPGLLSNLKMTQN